MRLQVKVVPNAARTAPAGWLGAVLKVRVAAVRERGAANAALCRLLAQVLAVPAAQVRLVAGHASARKVVEIAGLAPIEVQQRLDRALGEGAAATRR